eukprot:9189748-Pyramimonas_sp.AAC.1
MNTSVGSVGGSAHGAGLWDVFTVIVCNRCQSPLVVATRPSALPAGCPRRCIAAGCWAEAFVVQQYCLPPDLRVKSRPAVQPAAVYRSFLSGQPQQPAEHIAGLSCHGLG